MFKTSVILLNLLRFSFAADGEESPDEATSSSGPKNNNQTIIVDPHLNFTWSTDKIPASELFGLVPMPDGEDAEDTPYDVLTGYFELDLSKTELKLDDDASMRFCMQMYPKYNSDGKLNEGGKGKDTSKRYRTRFFNKKLSEYSFYPQVSKTHYTETDGTNKNLDWDFR